ncbi:MAG TPA: DUF4115 domain-containing protein [Bacillota bacterium]|nr:DUF4115 domain-containing protein [Bacillota bacterium]
MEELIALLKEARQGKKITLEEISRQTKIRQRYLEALEDGDFSLFAGEVYLKGTLANYAEIVGLDPKEILALYHRLKEKSGSETEPGQKDQPERTSRPSPPVPLPREKAEPRPRPEKPKKKALPGGERQGPSLTAGVIVVVMVLIAAGIWFSQNLDWRQFGSGPGSENNGGAPAENGTPDLKPEPEPQPPQEITVASSSAGETVFHLSGFNELELSLKFEGPCWVQLIVDGSEPFYPRTFAAGENYTAKAEKAVHLRMGNPPAVLVTVNGVELTENRDLTRPHNFLLELN